MATNVSLLEEHLYCPVCFEIFRNPVVLRCSHSFCEECLQKYWKNIDDVECPVCRKECSTEEPQLCLAFKSLCESLPRGSRSIRTQDICQQHGEKLKLFCFDDKQPICVVCYTSQKHKSHECAPIDEAVPKMKNKIQAAMSILKIKLKSMTSAKVDHHKWIEHIKCQAQHGEEQIKADFKELHRFLEEEETARISALKKEESKKCALMTKRTEILTKNITNLSEAIGVINKEIEVDDVTFLQNCKVIFSRAECTTPDIANAKTVSGALIDIAKHVGSLKFKVWEKMLCFVEYTPVTMDPNTVCSKLIITDDLNSVTYCEQKQSLPDNPERLQLGVLGAEGYNKGSHYWDVEVGDCENWTLGVAKGSIVRKQLVKMDPQSGIWSIKYVGGKYRAGVKSKTKINVDGSPRVIRIKLDCDKGELTFLDRTKNIALYTFKEKFKKKVFPYFSNGSPNVSLHILENKPILTKTY